MTSSAGEPPVVLITGASGGIGRATALGLADRGARLMLVGRSGGLLADLAMACERRGALADFAVVDVGDADDVQASVDEAVRRFGRLDVVVHTAATVAYGHLTEVPVPVWDKVIETGVTGTANVARSALATFQSQQHGHLVVIGSLLGQIAAPKMGSYVTTKWAVHGLVRVLQIEARSTPGVEVSMVAPGGIDTRIYTMAATYVGRSGNPPPPVLSAEAVARKVLAVVDRGRSSNRDAGPANWVVRLGFRFLSPVFDRLVGPLFEQFGLAKDHREPSVGNVFSSTEAVLADQDRRPATST